MSFFQLHPIALIPLIVLLAIFKDHSLISMLTALCIHEAGHIIAILATGCTVKSIRFSFGGIEIKTNDIKKSRAVRMIIRASGCLANLLSIPVALAICPLFPNYDLIIKGFCKVSAVMLCFNALPIAGLDGGEILYELADRFFLPDTAYRISKSTSLFFILIIWALSVYLLFLTNSNLSLILVCIALLISNIK